MNYWLVMKMSRWSDLKPSKPRTTQAFISIEAEPNCIGFLPIFIDYDDALIFADGDANYIQPIEIDEPEKSRLKVIK